VSDITQNYDEALLIFSFRPPWHNHDNIKSVKWNSKKEKLQHISPWRHYSPESCALHVTPYSFRNCALVPVLQPPDKTPRPAWRKEETGRPRGLAGGEGSAGAWAEAPPASAVPEGGPSLAGNGPSMPVHSHRWCCPIATTTQPIWLRFCMAKRAPQTPWCPGNMMLQLNQAEKGWNDKITELPSPNNGGQGGRLVGEERRAERGRVQSMEYWEAHGVLIKPRASPPLEDRGGGHCHTTDCLMFTLPPCSKLSSTHWTAAFVILCLEWDLDHCRRYVPWSILYKFYTKLEVIWALVRKLSTHDNLFVSGLEISGNSWKPSVKLCQTELNECHLLICCASISY
jgi:hypothetical protein